MKLHFWHLQVSIWVNASALTSSLSCLDPITEQERDFFLACASSLLLHVCPGTLNHLQSGSPAHTGSHFQQGKSLMSPQCLHPTPSGTILCLLYLHLPNLRGPTPFVACPILLASPLLPRAYFLSIPPIALLCWGHLPVPLPFPRLTQPQFRLLCWSPALLHLC